MDGHSTALPEELKEPVEHGAVGNVALERIGDGWPEEKRTRRDVPDAGLRERRAQVLDGPSVIG